MNELKAMGIFAEVASAGSFVSASRTLDLAPAQVTRAVADLEGHLGARLMTRTTRRVALTEVGERYLERVRTILQDVEEATRLARHAQTEARGEVRVIVPPEFAAHQLAGRMRRFHKAHPQVVVKITATGPVESLDPSHDISIVIKQSELDGDFVARLLARTEVVACATPEYLDLYGRPSHPSELAGHQLMLPPLVRGMTFSCLPGDACYPDECVAVAPTHLQMHSMNLDVHRASALAGIGIAGLASFAIDTALRDNILEHVLPTWHLSDLSIWACMPTRHHVAASTRAFMDFLIEEFGGSDGGDPWNPRRAQTRATGHLPSVRAATVSPASLAA